MSWDINPRITRPTVNLINEFEQLPTSVVSDAMNRLNSMKASVKPIIEGVKVAGPAVTVQCIVGDNLIIHQAIYIAQPGDVLVVDVRGHVDTSVWGYLMTRASMLRGIKAVVIDGAIRDLHDNKKSKFPIFCSGVVPAGSQKNWGGNINCPIQCAGVEVSPGDIIVGDDDGVVVVPRARAQEILKQSRQRLKTEDRWFAQIEKGQTTMEVIGLDKKLVDLRIKDS